MALLAAVTPYVRGNKYDTGWTNAGRFCTEKLTPQKIRSTKVKMFAKTIGFLKKNERPPTRSPNPDIVNDVRITTTVRAKTSVCAKFTPKINAAKKKDMTALSRPSRTWIIALPMKSGILWAGVARTRGRVPSH